MSTPPSRSVEPMPTPLKAILAANAALIPLATWMVWKVSGPVSGQIFLAFVVGILIGNAMAIFGGERAHRKIHGDRRG